MDSLTHIALGGLIGEAFLGKQLGKRAMVLGAVAQSIPDVDFVASFWLDASHNLLAHRGFTHSFLLSIILAPMLAWLAVRWSQYQMISFKKWFVFFGVQLLIHLFLDSLNAYGVGWFEPFSHQRISFNVIFVADPFYSFWMGISFFVLLWLGRGNAFRKVWIRVGLSISTIYLIYALFNKYTIDRDIQKIFNEQYMAYTRYFSTPTPLNNWLWYIVAEDEKGYHIGYRSVFDQNDSISFHYFPRNDSLLVSMLERDDMQQLLRFSQGYYTAVQQNDTLIFNDLRFGQQAGWQNPEAKFVFWYDLDHPDGNRLLVQRGRFAEWNKATVLSLYKRIKGN
jgi:inner membrane protein